VLQKMLEKMQESWQQRQVKLQLMEQLLVLPQHRQNSSRMQQRQIILQQ